MFEGSIITHINDQPCHNLTDYQNLANPRLGPRFKLKVAPPKETNTYKLPKSATNNPGLFVNGLRIEGVDDPRYGGVVNRMVERINGVPLQENDFERFRELTDYPGSYFISLSAD